MTGSMFCVVATFHAGAGMEPPPAIYSVLTAEEIGIRQSSLERVGLSKGGVVLNKKAVIRAGELIRAKATKREDDLNG